MSSEDDLQHEVDTLQEALASREMIGIAKGMIMERFEVDHERAWEYLVRISQNTNSKLNLLAEGIVATGEIPTPPTSKKTRRFDDDLEKVPAPGHAAEPENLPRAEARDDVEIPD